MKRVLSFAALAVAAASGAAAQAPAPPPEAAEQAVTVYPADFFAAARAVSAYDMIVRTPGFSFDSGATVRGFAGAAGNVLVDGERPLTKSETLDEILKRIPAASVLRIEVIRGGAPGIDMQGRTVLANVVRRTTGSLTGAAQANAFVLWDGRVLPGVRAEFQRRWQGRLLEASMVFGQGPDDLVAAGERLRVSGTGAVLIRSHMEAGGSGWRKWLTGAYETPLAGGRLRVNAVVQINPLTDDFTDTLIVPGGVEIERDSIRRKTGELGLRYTRPVGSRTGVEFLALETLTQNRPVIVFDSPSVDRAFDLDKRTGETIVRGLVKHRASPTLSFEAGGEGAYNWLTSRTSLIINGAPVVLPAANVRVEEKRGEAFAQATWRPMTTLTAEVGIRAEGSKITSSGDTAFGKTLFYPKPRAVLTWSPDPVDQVRLRLEREVGQLNFDDFVAASSVANTGTPIAGNPDINPQQAWVAEATYERRFWVSGVVGLTARYYRLSDVVDRKAAGNTVIDAPGNIGDGTRWEGAAQLTLPLGRLGVPGGLLKGLATWRRSRVIDPVTGASREISGLHPIDWELHFSQDLPRWRFNWGVDALGRYRETYYRVTEIETKEIKTLVTLFAEYKPRPDIIFHAEVQNATSRGALRIRRVYAGARNVAALSYVDIRDLQPGPIFLLRVRKLFG
ncbi:MAG TPA: TonB-dependent receptor [Caulobacteraceae bacterium]|nr:TonB-dependent receptor [Caulobacteraceae bacterium]